MSREGALWIGALESYMDEAFLRRALQAMGEENIVSIKVMKNKMTGENANYGFINFENDYSALLAMHKLNSKVIPETNPPVRFKLNHNSTRLMPGERDHSIWVGDLTPEVDDLQFYKFFSARFQTVKSAKVVFDQTGTSKCYGFVRFGNESEQLTALATMMNAVGLGGKPIKISSAVPKTKPGEFESGAAHSAAPAATSEAEYNQYWQSYNQYWSQMAAYNTPAPAYYDPATYYPPSDAHPTNQFNERNSKPTSQPPPSTTSTTRHQAGLKRNIYVGNNADLVDHNPKIDYDLLNENFISNSEELWEAIDDSRWTSNDVVERN